MNDSMREFLDWMAGTPLRVLTIVVAAALIQSFGSRAITRAMNKLASVDLVPGPRNIVARQKERASWLQPLTPSPADVGLTAPVAPHPGRIPHPPAARRPACENRAEADDPATEPDPGNERLDDHLGTKVLVVGLARAPVVIVPEPSPDLGRVDRLALVAKQHARVHARQKAAAPAGRAAADAAAGAPGPPPGWHR